MEEHLSMPAASISIAVVNSYSPLIRLPPELRNNIYEYLYPSREVNLPPISATNAIRAVGFKALTQLCRAIRAETLLFYHSSPTYRIKIRSTISRCSLDTKSSLWLLTLDPPASACLKKFKFLLPLNHGRCHIQVCIDLARVDEKYTTEISSACMGSPLMPHHEGLTRGMVDQLAAQVFKAFDGVWVSESRLQEFVGRLARRAPGYVGHRFDLHPALGPWVPGTVFEAHW